MKKTLILISLALLSLPTIAQEAYVPDRLPVLGKIILAQRINYAPETTLSKLDIDIKTYSTHSIGTGFGFDFFLTQPKPKKPIWALSSSLILSSAGVKYDATLPHERHGFDQDVSWSFYRVTTAVEGALGLKRIHPFRPKWCLSVGLGLNVQDAHIRERMLEQSVVTTMDGQTTHLTVVGRNNGFFGFGFSNNRTEQDIQFNPVFSVGLIHKADHKYLCIDLRVCQSKQYVVEQFLLQFGEPGLLKYKKSFVGLDISWAFSLNNNISSKF